ncbi:MAG: carbohydrate kinase [Candidatus Hinthialibacter antarcticus]|nr:carbohydrate kinase [Candidatus Hinthialibacter antarcticus]
MNPRNIVAFGEVLWDLLPGGPQLGGAPFNFCYRAHSLGMNAAMISRLGRDELGKQAHQRILELGVPDLCVQWDDSHPTGTVNITLDENNQPDYFIVPEVAYDFIQINETTLDAIRNADCICFGTLAQRSEPSRNTLNSLLNAADGAVKLCDINLRKNCYTQEIIINSLKQAQMMKINEDEAWMLRDMLPLKGDSLPAIAESLLTSFSLDACVITKGDKGAYARNRQGESVYEPGFQVNLVDPCGSGDAFTAAFMAKWLNQAPLDECCVWGNALGAMVATQAGATSPISPDEIEAFIQNPQQRLADQP